MNKSDKRAKETEAGDKKTSRRNVLTKAGKAAYVAPGLILLTASRKANEPS